MAPCGCSSGGPLFYCHKTKNVSYYQIKYILFLHTCLLLWRGGDVDAYWLMKKTLNHSAYMHLTHPGRARETLPYTQLSPLSNNEPSLQPATPVSKSGPSHYLNKRTTAPNHNSTPQADYYKSTDCSWDKLIQCLNNTEIEKIKPLNSDVSYRNPMKLFNLNLFCCNGLLQTIHAW